MNYVFVRLSCLTNVIANLAAHLVLEYRSVKYSIVNEHMNSRDEQDVWDTWQNLQRCHGKPCLRRKEVGERSREGERERELYNYFRQFHWPTKQSWADELALFNFNWSQLAGTLISNGIMQCNPMRSTASRNPYRFQPSCELHMFCITGDYNGNNCVSIRTPCMFWLPCLRTKQDSVFHIICDMLQFEINQDRHTARHFLMSLTQITFQW